LLWHITVKFCTTVVIVSGEQFEKLKDRDDQGWCTGRKSGRVGLYPDNYVKFLSQ